MARDAQQNAIFQRSYRCVVACPPGQQYFRADTVSRQQVAISAAAAAAKLEDAAFDQIEMQALIALASQYVAAREFDRLHPVPQQASVHGRKPGEERGERIVRFRRRQIPLSDGFAGGDTLLALLFNAAQQPVQFRRIDAEYGRCGVRDRRVQAWLTIGDGAAGLFGLRSYRGDRTVCDERQLSGQQKDRLTIGFPAAEEPPAGRQTIQSRVVQQFDDLLRIKFVQGGKGSELRLIDGKFCRSQCAPRTVLYLLL